MMNRAKVFCLKLLFCVTAMTFCASSPVQAEDSSGKTKPPPIFNLPQTDDEAKKEMKSTSFKSHKEEEKEAKEEDEEEDEEEEKPALEDIEEADFDESAESIAKKDKSPEQKLWDKYKALKENAEEVSEKDSKKDDDEDQKGESGLSDTEEESAGEKKKSTGITGIIEDYKKSQQDKGSLNTRSFGKID